MCFSDWKPSQQPIEEFDQRRRPSAHARTHQGEGHGAQGHDSASHNPKTRLHFRIQIAIPFVYIHFICNGGGPIFPSDLYIYIVLCDLQSLIGIAFMMTVSMQEALSRYLQKYMLQLFNNT